MVWRYNSIFFFYKLEYHKFLLWICTVLNILHTHASVVILKRNSGVASDLLLQSPTFASNRNLSSSMHDLSNKMSCIYRNNLYFPSLCLIWRLLAISSFSVVDFKVIASVWYYSWFQRTFPVCERISSVKKLRSFSYLVFLVIQITITHLYVDTI